MRTGAKGRRGCATIRAMKNLLLCVCLFVLALTGRAQSGTITIPTNTLQVHNIGIGNGVFQIPPPAPGATHLMFGVEVIWDHRLSSEVGPITGQTTCEGTWSHSWNRLDYWAVTAGVTPNGPITVMGERIYPAPLTLDYTIPPATTWDGVLDWQGPTAFSSRQIVIGTQIITTRSINTLTFPEPDYSLWLKVKTSGTPGLFTSYGGYGVAYTKLDSPWSATITYQYLP